jgi:hypothetical protein
MGRDDNKLHLNDAEVRTTAEHRSENITPNWQIS